MTEKQKIGDQCTRETHAFPVADGRGDGLSKTEVHSTNAATAPNPIIGDRLANETHDSNVADGDGSGQGIGEAHNWFAITASTPIPGGQVSDETHQTRAASGEGDGLDSVEAQCFNAVTLAELRALYRKWCVVNEQVKRSYLALGAFLRTDLSKGKDLPAGARKQIKERAKAIIKIGERSLKGRDIVPDPDYNEYREIVMLTLGSVAPFAQIQKECEKAMEKLVKELPFHEWSLGIEGLGWKGLVCVAALVGDMSDFPTVSRVWKRLGLAPDECYPRGEKKTGRKIPRSIRGQIYGNIFIPLALAQFQRCDKETGEIIKPPGPYGELYYRKKAEYLDRGLIKAHADALAKRVMTKELILGLYLAWNAKIEGKPMPLVIRKMISGWNRGPDK